MDRIVTQSISQLNISDTNGQNPQQKQHNPNPAFCASPSGAFRKLLDDRYELHHQIGVGRYAKVKLATDLNSQKPVAIKILRAKQGILYPYSKEEALECFRSEIEILERCTQLKLPNIVRIKHASFEGCIVKVLRTPSDSPTNQGNGNDDQDGPYSSQNNQSCEDPHHFTNSHDENRRRAEVERQLQGLDHQGLTSGQSPPDSDGDYRPVGLDPFQRVIKRQFPVCYYVMSFAEYGELYNLIDQQKHRLTDNLIRYLFAQLLEGLKQLHLHGFVHRDIKPENLLIDSKYRLIIADFNFARRLKPRINHQTSSSGQVSQNNQQCSSQQTMNQHSQNQTVSYQQYSTIPGHQQQQQTQQTIFTPQQYQHSSGVQANLVLGNHQYVSQFDPIVVRDLQVGSEAYNSPELWILEEQDQAYRLNSQTQHEGSAKLNDEEKANAKQIQTSVSHTTNVSTQSALQDNYNQQPQNCSDPNYYLTQTHNAQQKAGDEQQPKLIYDGVKSDVFSAAAMHFMMTMKLGPFRRAHLKDPYYKRLAHKDKKYFWKIYQEFPTSAEFRNLFELMTCHEPDDRLSLSEAQNHAYFLKPIDEEEAKNELRLAFKNHNLKSLGSNHDDTMPQGTDCLQVCDADAQQAMTVEQDSLYEEARLRMVPIIQNVSLRIKYAINLKKITKEAQKSMIAEPQTCFQTFKKDSMHSQQQQASDKKKATGKLADSDEANASGSSNEARYYRHQQALLRAARRRANGCQPSYSDGGSQGSRDSQDNEDSLKKIRQRSRRRSSLNEGKDLNSSQEFDD